MDLNREPTSCGWSAGNDIEISEFCLALCSFTAAAFLQSADEATSFFFSCGRELGVLGSKFDMVGGLVTTKVSGGALSIVDIKIWRWRCGAVQSTSSLSDEMDWFC